jgi:predicted RNase H-like HicB family nuclease
VSCAGNEHNTAGKIRGPRSSANTHQGEILMKAEFTAIIEPAPEGGFWAICPEVPGANGQGETLEETKENLRQAIELILEDRKADMLRGLSDDAIQDTVMVG